MSEKFENHKKYNVSNSSSSTLRGLSGGRICNPGTKHLCYDEVQWYYLVMFLQICFYTNRVNDTRMLDEVRVLTSHAHYFVTVREYF